jgi:predicted phosphodiesterase
LKRVAVATDIHGNRPALEASLQAIDAIGVDGLFFGGDLVGYGPHPNEVCRLIEPRAIPTIYGNYDYAIARDLDDCGCAYVTQHDRELGQQSVAWTLEHTDQASKDFMRGLPFDLRFELGSQQVHLVHGSPRKARHGAVVVREDRLPQTPLESLPNTRQRAQSGHRGLDRRLAGRGGVR